VILPPGQYLATVTFRDTDAVPKDNAVWKFAFNTTVATTDINMAGVVSGFYNAIPAGALVSLSSALANSVDRGANAVTIKIYNITGALGVGAFHGTPVSVLTDTLSTPAAQARDLPAQATLVLATNANAPGILEHGPSEVIPSTESAIDQGAPATHPARSRPLSRTRGRMFLGPFNLSALAATGDNINAVVLDAACHAAVDLVVASLAIASPWSVWSKVDAVLRPIAHGYCESKFGTQRRRREVAPPRSVWP
jgi:hypothetical protein